MTTVYWCPATIGLKLFSDNEITFFEPSLLAKEIADSREGSEYLKCPAFIDYCRNVYVIRAPFDLTINVDAKEKQLYVNGTNQAYFEEFFRNRGDERSVNDPYMVTAPPRYLFYSMDSVEIEAMPAFLQANQSIENTNLIPGRFNIGKWMRPIEFTFELKEHTKQINIKRGDALFYVRFTDTKNPNAKIVLERVIMTKEMTYAIQGCVRVKDVIPKVTLPALYEMARPFMALLKDMLPRSKK